MVDEDLNDEELEDDGLFDEDDALEAGLRRRIHYHRRKGNMPTLAACRSKLESISAEFSEDRVLGAIRVRTCGIDLFFALGEVGELYGYARSGAYGGSWHDEVSA